MSTDVRRWAAAAIVVLAVGSAACGADDDDGEAAPSPPVPSTEVLVELRTSGGEDGQGIGGVVVSADGSVEHTDGGTATLPADELEGLVAVLEDADFAGAPTEPDIDDVCPDALVSTVTYQQWEITADSCTIPDDLAPVFDELQRVLAMAGG